MDTEAQELERVYQLWDNLHQQDASQPDVVREKLLHGLASMFGASNAYWAAAVRSNVMDNDTLGGWRVRLGQFLHTPPDPAHATKHEKYVGKGANEITVRGFAEAGRHRAYLLRDLVDDSWFSSEYYRTFYAAADIADAIFIGAPITGDAEVCVCLYRGHAQPRFAPQDRQLAAFAIRGLGWLHCQQLLSAGYLVAHAPLSRTETKVLKGLLAGSTSKQIAEELGHSQHTTHEYVRRIYQKYGVSNRSSLLALWLGRRLQD